MGLQEKRGALEQELDSLELAINKVREKPTLSGARFVRGRKDQLKVEAEESIKLLGDILREDVNEASRTHTQNAGAVHQAEVSRRFRAVEEALREEDGKLSTRYPFNDK